MTDTQVPTSSAGNPIGFGRMIRKEDVRFVRGHGNYVDDVVLPGMLHGAILRSPYAHAKINSIDTSAAEAHPKVRAVITGATLETLGLAWMPTLSYDTQAVLATDKVRFHGQEVAFVIADDRYSARDALELIEADYEPLDPVVDAKKALDPDAPVIRTDKVAREGTEAGPLEHFLLTHPRLKHWTRALYTLRSALRLKGAMARGVSHKDYLGAGHSVDGVDAIEPVAEILRRWRQSLVGP